MPPPPLGRGVARPPESAASPEAQPAPTSKDKTKPQRQAHVFLTKASTTANIQRSTSTNTDKQVSRPAGEANELSYCVTLGATQAPS
jgi:hypothetical protein